MNNTKTIDFKDRYPLILAGGPNVGKSVIFNLLTSQYVTVSNYPGTTVEITTANSSIAHAKFMVLDTPGINSLMPYSEDERVTRDILLKYQQKIVVHVFDTKNFTGNLMLTFQLIEMGVPLVLDLNMFDEAQTRGVKIDTEKLAKHLGIGVVATIATEKVGLNKLVSEISKAGISEFNIDYGEKIEAAIAKISGLLPALNIAKRLAALLLLSKDVTFKRYLLEQGVQEDALANIDTITENTKQHFTKSLKSVIIEKRHKKAEEIFKSVSFLKKASRTRISDKIGLLMVSPHWGVPIAILIMYATYLFVGKFGAGFLVDLIENKFFNSFLNPLITNLVDNFIPIAFIKDILVGEYGLVTMALTYSFAIIFPIVTTFFIVFGILEDSGYLPRLAAVVNRLFKFIGLHGKAVLPFILGLGCGTMAVLTTRILETKKERLIATLLLAMAIPCSAQLGVILGMLGGISFKIVMVWLAILLAILVLIGYLSSKLIAGEISDFMLELPPVRLPQISNILIKVRARLIWYLKEAVPLFILGTLLLFVLDKFNALSVIRDFVSPVVVNFLGLPAKSAEAFIIGFLRRDYGAAGLYALQRQGELSNLQVLVSVLTMTLLVPCVAQFFVMIKERGLKVAILIFVFVLAFAVLMGGLINFIFRAMAMMF
ncbi:MAG: ferrous iron transport protein B [Candidatus Omnitrophica bacterium CG11_big_fil_rev_8_21_14_0_20_42_13]|uniref:Ferrous iron transport protein B n=1 Tax=Candidatus Ghiorseimicrobium undicola TaxID=1974746 RepID=A0A2H0LV79_9BACT|nr:MAG: ferrous iron transport protein B [Candidatus Omnitrophica bacterium CG11_big_fil_rev_8_21_14_0_20_42_13]